MKHASFFNGVGGFQLAAEWVGWENVMSCEINKLLNHVTRYYWPNCIQHEDIRDTDFTIYRNKIDIITGGFPCQPYSLAGKRKGKEDDRHLWPEMLRGIREIQPPFVVGENVFGLINWRGGLVFDEVQADLEAAGYEVIPFILPACAVNAPHRRDRIWFVAHHTNSRIEGLRPERENPVHGFEVTANAFSKRHSTTANQTNSDYKQSDGEKEQADRNYVFPKANRHSDFTSNGNNYGLQGSGNHGIYSKETQPKSSRLGSTHFITHSNGIGLRGESNGFGKSRFVGEANTPDDWQNFPTQSPICGGDDGLPCQLDGITVSARKGRRVLNQNQTFSKWRQESIKAYGNAIVPQVALEIFKAINKTLEV
jgi:DNA (cytosine-5)-methyltransferase 1